MGLFRDVSIKKKLRRITMLTTSVALLLTGVAFIVYEMVVYRSVMTHELMSMADVVATNSTAALLFGNSRDATETLQALRGDPRIMSAAIYTKEANVFATYHSVNSEEDAIPVNLRPDGSVLEGGRLMLFRPIILEHERIGTLYIRADTREMYARLRVGALIVVGLLLASSLVALMLSVQLGGVITQPILNLAQVAATVSERQDYSVRAAGSGQDELGQLIGGFNEMLAQIQQRDVALHEAQDRLEATVEERTRQLQAAKQQAEEASHHKSIFLSNMSHELRTPLNAIIGYSEMLQERADELSLKDFGSDTKKINTAAKHLLTLINDILDLSKIEAGRMVLYLETFDISAIIEDVVRTIAPLVEKSANTLEVSYGEHLGSMRADATKVREVLFNLLSNACKFTERGTITLTVARETVDEVGWIVFDVKDTGIGISPDQMENLFQAFWQADVATSSKYGGTGLGLAISRQFCQVMGGSIAVKSALGEGSTFTIRLPAEVVDAKAESVPRVETLTAETFQPPEGMSVVLAIDDDPSALDLINRFLAKEGFYVVTASSGAEGLRMARELRPLAITLDVVMSAIDGWTVLTALKADPDLADIPVIMLTITDNKEMGYALGAFDYLTKPIDRDRLVTVLKKCRRDPLPGLILVVDDDVFTRESIRSMLEKDGWDVAVAEHGRAALECVTASQPEVILLDLIMPEMDGFEFIGELRKHHVWRSIPVVVITAKDLTREDCLRLNHGVQTILQKGAYSRDELLREVHKLVKTYASAKEPRSTHYL